MGMTAFTLDALLRLDDGQFQKSLSGAEGKMSGFGDKLSSIGKGVANVAKVGAAAVTAAAAVTGKLVMSAVDAYSSYQQLTGGVETLFGTGGQSLEEYQRKIGITEKSTQKQVEASIQAYSNMQQAQELVMQNAHKAYKTAGLDANAYMETVTSFSAALLQGLNGDTVKAAQISDMALIDMADNAAKMGTDMSAIQSAYSGFAKQNYTMLDNLKLGYGGTRTEMQRLLKDAQKLTGKRYNLNNLSDVYEAIHAIQEEMGIAGTTAKEAATTIEGSTAMMKASWENLKIAMVSGENVGQAISDFTESVKTAASNWIPAIKQGLQGFGQVVQGLAPIINAELPGLINDIVPGLISAATGLVPGIIQGLVSIIPAIAEALPSILQSLFDAIPTILSGLWEGIKSFALKLGGIVFGTKEDGSVNWPDWDTVKEAAGIAWQNIKDKALEFAGLVFGKKEDGTVAWPTWADVVQAGREAWQTIKDRALKFAGLVFGKKEDGSVAWPTWDDVATAANSAWELIKTGALGLAGLVLGKKADGTVNWPTWADVVNGAREAWQNIKDWALQFSGLVLGKKGDGTVNWPTWTDVMQAARSAWQTIKDWALKFAGLVFGKKGDGSVNWPTWKDVESAAIAAWDLIKAGIEGIANWVVNIPGMPSLYDLGVTVRDWWNNTVIPTVFNALKWLIGVPSMADSDGTQTRDIVKEWWSTLVVPLIKGVTDFVLGLFDLPSVAEQVARIKAWWERVKGDVGPLGINILVGITQAGQTMGTGLEEKEKKTLEKAVEQAQVDTVGELFTKQNPFNNAIQQKTMDRLKTNITDGFLNPIKDMVIGVGEALGVTSTPSKFEVPAGTSFETLLTSPAPNKIFPGFAKGSIDIPHDMIAQLHRNEMVLTASQARQYREGQGSFDVAALSNAIVAAVKQGLQDATVRSYLDGRELTDAIGRIMGEDLTARRFA